jgi:hypothetical protein
MKHELSAGLGVAGLILVLAVGGLRAKHAGHEQHGAAPAQSKAEPTADPGTIFCPTMKTGQLCSHGTADQLSLEGAKREAWIAAARRYNRAVDEATKHLLSDAESLLTAEEKAEVERWFQKGLNPQINQLLSSAEKPAK